MSTLLRMLSLALSLGAAVAQSPPAEAAHAITGIGLERAFPRLRFQRPVFLTGAGDGSGRLFVVEQDGVIRVFTPDERVGASRIFLDIRERVSRAGNEEGLLGLAFAPDYARSGVFYVHYSSAAEQQGVVSRFRVSARDADRADPASEQVLLAQPQPWRNHNGGALAFGPDGMLYVSFGDGGSANDPHGNGQDMSTWLGAILRLDVSGPDAAYAVPTDNPFVGAGYDVRPEIWAYGLRNVWRFAFDRETGALWAGDVGQNRWEEVDRIVAGGNYGWNAYEADARFERDGETPSELRGGAHEPPVASYGRDLGMSITGGAVYRGSRHPELYGQYLFGDYVSGNLWALDADDPQAEARLVRRTGKSIASFGEDDDGELYLLAFDGAVYRVVPSDAPDDPLTDWPERLSQTALFTADPARILPYEVNAPFWSDGAEKQRFVVLPEGAALGLRAEGSWHVPVGATLIKTFTGRDRGRPRQLETRLIVRTADGWQTGTYLWERDGSDARLIPEGRQFELWNRDTGVTTWHAPSSSECTSCHVEAAGFVLGLTTAQLNRAGPEGRNQISDWIARGLASDADGFDPAEAARHVDPYAGGADLDARARTWLDVNCAFCHQPGGAGNAAIDLRASTPLWAAGLLDARPAQGELGLDDARIVAPGAPERSLLWQRVRALGEGRMPPLASNLVDERGAALLAEWIRALE